MLITIISGAYGHNDNGIIRVVRPGGKVDLSEAEAKRLIAMGIAEPEEIPEEMKSPDGMLVGHLDSEMLNTMPFEQLKQMATDAGLQVGKLKSRENIVAALVEQDSFAEAEEVPDLNAEDPVV